MLIMGSAQHHYIALYFTWEVLKSNFYLEVSFYLFYFGTKRSVVYLSSKPLSLHNLLKSTFRYNYTFKTIRVLMLLCGTRKFKQVFVDTLSRWFKTFSF